MEVDANLAPSGADGAGPEVADHHDGDRTGAGATAVSDETIAALKSLLEQVCVWVS